MALTCCLYTFPISDLDPKTMHRLGFTATETLLWDYSNSEEFYVLAIPPAIDKPTLFLVPNTYAYQWYGLNGSNGLQVIYYPFLNMNFTGLQNPCHCPPIIFFLTPSQGFMGDTVVITGLRLSNATLVTFGGVPAMFTPINDTTISAIAPISTGIVDVQVTTSGGVSALTPNDQFTYLVVSGFADLGNWQIVPRRSYSFSKALQADFFVPFVAPQVVVVLTWDPTTTINVALSLDELTATNNIVGGVQGAMATGTGLSSGKYYFEVTVESFLNPTRDFTTLDIGVGPDISGSGNSYQNILPFSGQGAVVAGGNADVIGTGSFNSTKTTTITPALVTGDVIGIAVDLDNHKFYAINTSSSNSYDYSNNFQGWNSKNTTLGLATGTFQNSVSDPAFPNANGTTAPSTTLKPMVVFNSGSQLDWSVTFNLGDTNTPFSQAVPYGFASGWGTPSLPYSKDRNWSDVIFLCGFESSIHDESGPTNNKGEANIAATGLGYVEFDTNNFEIGNSSLFMVSGNSGLSWPNTNNDFFLTNQPFTVEAWINTLTISAATYVICSLWDPTGSHQSWRLVMFTGGAAGAFQFQISTTGADSITILNTGDYTNVNIWVPIAVDFDGTTYRIYADGNMQAKSTTLHTFFSPASTLFTVGSSPSGANCWNGRLDEIRVTKGVARYASDGGYSVDFNSFPRLITSVGPVGLTDPDGVGGVFGNTSKSSGKFYFEVTIVTADNPSGGDNAFGIGGSGATFNTLVNNNGTNGVTFFPLNNGNIYIDHSFVTNIGDCHPGDVLAIAFDCTAKKFWVKCVAGPNASGPVQNQWNGNNATNNPVTGISDCVATASAPYLPYFGFDTSGVPGDSYTANFGGSAFSGTIPTGFSAWGAAAIWDSANGNGTNLTNNNLTANIAPTTLDPVTKLFTTLSSNHLTATVSQVLTPEEGVTALLSAASTSGKYYYEITMSPNIGNAQNGGIGFGLTTASYFGLIEGGYGGIMAYVGGNVDSNGGTSQIFFILSQDGGSGGGFFNSDGDIVGVAIDLDHGNMWVNTVGGPDGGFTGWNGTFGNPGQDPSTNQGGIPIPDGLQVLPAGTSGLIPIALFGAEANIADDGQVANFGGTPFVGTIPTGFTTWPLAGSNSPPAFTTWDPTTGTVTLSNGNLTATNTGVSGTNQGVKGNIRKTSGKWYFEITLTHLGTSSADFCLGITNTASSFTAVLAGVDVGSNYVQADGVIIENNGGSASTLGQLHTGDVIGCAIDMSSQQGFYGEFWYKVVAGPDAAGAYWNGHLTADPTTSGSGLAVDFSTTVPFVTLGNLDATNSVTANFGATAFSGVVPTGYRNWQPVNAIPTTLDPTTAVSVTASNGNLTATNVLSYWTGVFSTTTQSTGKWYFEVHYVKTNNAIVDQGAIVIAPVSAGTVWSDMIGGSGNPGTPSATGVFTDAGGEFSYLNGGAFFELKNAITNTSNDVYAVAVDLTNNKAWFRIVSGATNLHWNDNVAANPATNVGGIPLHGGATHIFAVNNFVGEGGTDPSMTWTANFGASAFTGAVPAGFSAWGGSTTWDPAQNNQTTLSNGNLTATQTVINPQNQGIKVPTNASRNPGKYYFEVTYDQFEIVIVGGQVGGIGICLPSATFTNLNSDGTGGVICSEAGWIASNGSTNIVNIGQFIQTGDVVGVAVNLDDNLIWFKIVSGPHAGQWNDNVKNDPAASIGGIRISLGFGTNLVPFISFGYDAYVGSDIRTANFGATPFVGTVPKGYQAGWTT